MGYVLQVGFLSVSRSYYNKFYNGIQVFGYSFFGDIFYNNTTIGRLREPYESNLGGPTPNVDLTTEKLFALF
jgi:hypothetical protein